MIKLIFLILTFFSFIKADYQIIKNDNLFLVEIKDNDFEQVLINLKDEIIFQGFNIVYELDLAKSTNGVAQLLEKKGVLNKGINIGICKSSFTFSMVEENFNNINYCPLGLSVYSIDNKSIFLSYKIYKPFKKGNEISTKINETLKNLIIKSLD